MAVNLSPLGGVAGQFFDNNGDPLSGGKLYTYAAGTTTPQVSYTSSSGTTANTNSIILNSAGRVPSEIWLTDGLVYKFVLYSSTNQLIGSWDNVSGINDFSSLIPIVYTATGTGSQVAFNLISSPTSKNSTQIYINGVYQQKNTYSISNAIVTFSEAPPVTSTIEINYV